MRGALFITGRTCAALLSALSLLVCAASVAGWVRGYRAVGVYERTEYRDRAGDSTSTVHRVSSGRGVVAVTFSRRWNGRYRPGPPDYHHVRYSRTKLRPDQFNLLRHTPWQRLGFHRYAGGDSKLGRGGRLSERTSYWGFRLPYWLVVPATGIPPVLYLRTLGRLRRRRRARRGLCPGCGYDLTGNVSGVCPECGETVAAPAAPRLPVATGLAT